MQLTNVAPPVYDITARITTASRELSAKESYRIKQSWRNLTDTIVEINVKMVECEAASLPVGKLKGNVKSTDVVIQW